MLTADTYTSVLPTTQHQAAEATARLVLTAARTALARTTGRHRPDRPTPRPTPATSTDTTTVTYGQGNPRHRSSHRATAPSKHLRSTHRPRRTKKSRKGAGQMVGRQGSEP